MSSDWTTYKLGDLCETVTKGTTPTSIGGKFSPSGINFIKVESIEPDGRFITEKFAYIDSASDELLKRSRLRSGDILFTIAGTIGRVAVVDKSILPANTNQAVAIIRIKQNAPVLPKFVEICLRSPQMLSEVGGGVIGGVQANYSLTNIKALKLRAPTLPEQQKICSVISALQDSVRNLRHQNTTLEAIAQRLFRSWFVNFDPVHAKAAGKEPEAMSAELAAWFPSEFEDSELGPIPKGWSVTTFGDAFDIKGGATPSTAEPQYWEGGTHAWATPKDMSSLTSKVIYRTERQITAAGVAKISSKTLPAGTVLMSSRAPVGYLAIAKAPISINQGFIAVPPTPGVPASFVVELLAHKMPDIKANAGGTTFAEISKTQFRPIKWIRPSDEVLAAFGKLVEPLFAQVHGNCLLLDSLADLRDHLLPRLISGKLSLEDAEQVVADTVTA